MTCMWLLLGCCRNLCFTCRCKVFLPFLLLYVVLLAVACPTVFLKLWHRTEHHSIPASPTPSHVSGMGTSVLTEIQLGASVSSVTLAVNCSGKVFVSDAMQCSALNHTTTAVNNSPMQYLLTGSSFNIEYNSRQLHQLAIIKSLSNFQEYCGCSDASDFCFEQSKESKGSSTTSTDECVRNCDLTVVCAHHRLHQQSGVNCINTSEESYSYTVQSDDWFYQQFGYPCPTYHIISVEQYDRSQVQSGGGFKTYTLAANLSVSSTPYSVSFPVTADTKCVLLDVQCPSNRAVYEVQYSVTSSLPTPSSSNWPSFVVLGVIVLIGVVLFLAQVIIFFGRRSGLQHSYQIN